MPDTGGKTKRKGAPSIHSIRRVSRGKTLQAALASLFLISALLSGCGGPRISPPQSPSQAEPSRETSGEAFTQTGIASWYGPDFHGQQTACGETYDMYAMTAAHKQLPFHSRVRVTNLNNGKQVVVRINDRGPFRKQRIIDLSFTAAQRLDMVEPGTSRVRLEVVDSGAPREKRFTLQLGSFTREENARRSKRRAKDLGLSDVRVRKAELDGKSYFRIRAGEFTSRSEAGSALGEIRHHFPDSFILRD